MVRDDLVRWGLHELEGSGYVANDAGTSGTASVNVVVETTVQNNYDPTAPVLYWVNEGIQVAVGEVVRAEEVEQNEEISVPFQFSPPPIPPSPTTANDAVIAQALHEEFQKLAAAEAAGQACAKDKVRSGVLSCIYPLINHRAVENEGYTVATMQMACRCL